MSFANRTPESLLPRSDSKNPTTTCRGTTTSGRPCRRSLASPKSSPASTPRKQSLGLTIQDHNGVLDATLLYCWQHKDQTQNTTIDAAISAKQNAMRPAPIQERSSLDSLVARLGVMSVQDIPQQKRTSQNARTRHPMDNRQHTHPTRPIESVSKPQGTSYTQPASIGPKQPSEKHETRQRKRPGFWASLCCMSSADDDDYYEIVKHKHRVPPPRPGVSSAHEAGNGYRPTVQYPRPSAPVYPTSKPTGDLMVQRLNAAASSASVPLRKPLAELSPRHTNMRTTSTPDTRQLLSFIPHQLSPQTTSALLTELSKPISTHDEEGYIYIFWLTDSSATPSSDTAASLLSPPTSRHQRRPSDVMSEYSRTTTSRVSPQIQKSNTIKLKIGRANNVHRRMNEWNRQCGYNLSLVRYYPYNPSSSQQPSPAPFPTRSPALYPDSRIGPGSRKNSDQARKVRWAARVERLVHIELADMRAKKSCQQCGREHREWFEIEATENGVKGVDEVIRRWVGWAETVDKIAP